MKSTVIFLLFIMAFVGSASAEEKSESNSETNSTTESQYHFMLGYGSEYRPERDVEKNYSQHYFTNYAAGIGKGHWTFIFEKSQFKESSGNSTLNLERSYQDYLLIARYYAYSAGVFSAFGNVGVGAYQESVTTNFSGQSITSNGKHKLLTTGGMGIQANLSIFFTSLEARLLFGDELDQQASLSGIARLGLWF